MAAPKGNNYKTKFKTSEERRELCKLWCEHLAAGFSKTSFVPASHKTMDTYIRNYPEDFPSDQIEAAYRQGQFEWEEIGKDGTTGKIKGFNAKSWEMIVNNKLGWAKNEDTRIKIEVSQGRAQEILQIGPESTDSE